jgi:hypothetical protein
MTPNVLPWLSQMILPGLIDKIEDYLFTSFLTFSGFNLEES